MSFCVSSTLSTIVCATHRRGTAADRQQGQQKSVAVAHPAGRTEALRGVELKKAMLMIEKELLKENLVEQEALEAIANE